MQGAHEEDEGEGVEGGAERLVDGEFQEGVFDVELRLDQLGRWGGVELFLIVGGGGLDRGG